MARFLCFLLLFGCARSSDQPEEDGSTDAQGPGDAKGDAVDAPFDGALDATMDAGASFGFMVVRLGKADGGALTAVSAPVFLEERSSIDGALVRTLTLPTAADGGNAALTLGGTATTEGALATSGDGKFVVLAGFGAPVGVAVSTSSSVTYKRVIARVDKAGAIDTTTKLTAFSATAIRGATTDDGTAFWAVGGSTGVIYAVLGAATGTTISTTVVNNRAVQIYGGQLYASTQTGAYRVFTVGTGLPTTAGQVGANLAGVTGNSPNGFAFADLTMVTGIDTLYVADERAVPNGGVEKWTSNGATWSLVTTFNDGITSGCSHVLAAKVGAESHVVCATLESPSRLVRYVDDGMNMNPMAVVLATAAPGTVFRGVALSPQ